MAAAEAENPREPSDPFAVSDEGIDALSAEAGEIRARRCANGAKFIDLSE